MKTLQRLAKVVQSHIAPLTVRVSREEYDKYTEKKQHNIQSQIEQELGVSIAELQIQNIDSLKRQRLEAGPCLARRCWWRLHDLLIYLWKYTPPGSLFYPLSFWGHAKYEFVLHHERTTAVVELRMFRKITDETAKEFYREDMLRALLVEKNAINATLLEMIKEVVTPALVSKAGWPYEQSTKREIVEKALKRAALEKLPTITGTYYQPRYDKITVEVRERDSSWW